MSKEISFNNLFYYYKNPKTALKTFIDFRVPIRFYNNIRNGERSIKKIEEDKKN